MDVYIKCMRFEGIAVSPNPVEHVLSRKHAAGRFEEVAENLKFLGSEIHGTPIDPDLMTLKIHVNSPDSIRVGIVRWGVCLTTSEDGAHPRNEFPHTVPGGDQINPLIIFLETVFIGVGK